MQLNLTFFLYITGIWIFNYFDIEIVCNIFILVYALLSYVIFYIWLYNILQNN